jgi:hypothetical protein
MNCQDCEKEVRAATAPMWVTIEHQALQLRQISQLCWEIVNELQEADNLLVGEYPDEFSKVFDIASEIEDWLVRTKKK